MEVLAVDFDVAVHNPRAINAPQDPDSLGSVVPMPSDLRPVLRSIIAAAEEASVPVPIVNTVIAARSRCETDCASTQVPLSQNALSCKC